MRKWTEKFLVGRFFAASLAAVLLFATAANTAAAQKNKKNKSADPPTSDQATPPLPTSDNEQIETDIGEMLGAFQLGDVDLMHKHYSDNVTFVSGEYEPPIVGWQNYATMYQRQRPAFQGMQLIRRNTLIVVQGEFAWATYQWEFTSLVSGRPYALRGHTTLIFNKVSGNWLIVHNHTSGIYPEETASTGAVPATPVAAQR